MRVAVAFTHRPEVLDADLVDALLGRDMSHRTVEMDVELLGWLIEAGLMECAYNVERLVS